MKKLVLVFLVVGSSAFAQRSTNERVASLLRFVGAAPVAGQIQCADNAQPSCVAVVSQWKSYLAEESAIVGSGNPAPAGSLRALIDLSAALKAGQTPKVGCSDWDCGDAVQIVVKINAAKAKVSILRQAFLTAVVKIAATDDALAGFLSQMTFK
jgi:hypothetical protein